MTSSPRDWRRWGVRKYLPKRSSVTGPEAKGASQETQQWSFPDLDPSDREKRILLAACIAIGVREVFVNHAYSFGGNLCQQLIGGL